MKYIIEPMSYENALKICTWEYEEPYSIYSMGSGEASMKELLCGAYYSAVTENHQLAGYFCFGVPATVPAGRDYGLYDDTDAMDIGLGMNPKLCGRGLGLEFINAGIQYAYCNLAAQKLRLTVIVSNIRAIKVYERLGFVKIGSFLRKSDIDIMNLFFDVMVKK